jgi:hypothetical protein
LFFLRRTAKFLNCCRSFSRNLFERCPKYFKFQNSEYAGHQVGQKDLGSRNFSFLALKGEAVGVALILHSTATARDTRKHFFGSNHVFSHKKS